MPFDKSWLQQDDGFIGPVFTSPAARGMVYLQVLIQILHYLKQSGAAKRVVLFIDEKNSAAARIFYRRLGFREIPFARGLGVWLVFWSQSRAVEKIA